MKILKKLITVHLAAFTMGLVFLVLLGSHLLGSRERILFRVAPSFDKAPLVDTVARYPNAVVLSSGELEVPDPPFLMRLLSPTGPWMLDPFYTLLIISLCIILITCFWNFTPRHPFSRSSLRGIRYISWSFGIFLLASMLRGFWFNTQVSEITNGGFLYDGSRNIIFMPEFWIFLLLLRLAPIFKQGNLLQAKQDPTT